MAGVNLHSVYIEVALEQQTKRILPK